MTGFSALPLAHEEGDDGQSSRKFKGVSRIVGPRWTHMPALTVGLLGVQIFWSVEMSYASPYLLSLGLSKSRMAVVFLAGPLSGLIMQPLIGVLADSSTSRFGRRRPSMLLGTVVCMLGMLLLGFTRPVASIFTSLGSQSNDVLTIWFAVFAIYLIDFSINAVQAMDRALLVDSLPPSQQASGNAWAARMLGVGSVLGFFVGNLDLRRALPFLGKTQLEVLSVIVSILLLTGHLIMAFLVKERILIKSPHADGPQKSNALVQELKAIWCNMLTLPWVIRQICFIQFCSWIAWFPILFYSTIYVGDLHKRNSPIPATDEAKSLLDVEATRLGSRALFFSSVLSLFANLALPLFVPEAAGRSQNRMGARPSDESWWQRLCRVPPVLQIHLASLWAFSHLVFAACMFATFFAHTVFSATILITVTGFAWAITQWAPFSLLAEAILTEPGPATLEDAGSIQLADARTRPPRDDHDTSIASEDSDDDDDDDDDLQKSKENRRLLLGNSGAHLSSINVAQSLGSGSRGVHEDGYEMVHAAEEDDDPRMARQVGEGDIDFRDQNSGGLSAKAGIILGIHNVFIVIPQFLVTGLSSIIFAIFDPQKSGLPSHHGSVTGPVPVNGTRSADPLLTLKNASTALTETILRRDTFLFHATSHVLRDPSSGEMQNPAQSNSVVYIFRFGGIAATFAFVLCWRLARELRHR